MKADIKKRYETNLDLLNLIVNFCVENNLKATVITEACAGIFIIPCNDELWIALKDKLKSDERFYQQPIICGEFHDSQIRVKNDRPGNTLARVSIEYYWEKGKNTFYDKVASKLELRILAGRGFAGNKEYKQIVVDLLKNIYTDAENLNYDQFI